MVAVSPKATGLGDADGGTAPRAPFDWADPLGYAALLSEDERMLSEAARRFAADKLAALHTLLDRLGIPAEEAGYMGDDLIDLRAMAACGFSASPADGHRLARQYARFVCSHEGGRGAVREVCEFILGAQGKLEAALAPYLPSPAP